MYSGTKIEMTAKPKSAGNLETRIKKLHDKHLSFREAIKGCNAQIKRLKQINDDHRQRACRVKKEANRQANAEAHKKAGRKEHIRSLEATITDLNQRI